MILVQKKNVKEKKERKKFSKHHSIKETNREFFFNENMFEKNNF